MSLPNPQSQAWSTEHIGGSTNDPVILQLEETNLITNGDFEEALSGWSNEAGTAPSRVDAGSEAARGQYVMRLQTASVTHKAIAFTGTKVLLTGFVKFITTDSAGSFDVDLYITGDANYVAAPAADFVSVTINSEDIHVDATEYFMPFYAELEVSSADSYLHINFGCDTDVEVYIDDLKVYEVNKNVELAEPNTLSMHYQYIKDADYNLYDGTNKFYSRGWRPVYKIGYDYINAQGLFKDIGLTESMFNFFIPHSNNMGGWYVRSHDDYNQGNFHNKFLGHSKDLELQGIFLIKNKFREFGESYFSVASG